MTGFPPHPANMVMAGALIGSGLLPFNKEKFERHLQLNFQGESLASNLKAFHMGFSEILR